jgi:hypothetical protein
MRPGTARRLAPARAIALALVAAVAGTTVGLVPSVAQACRRPWGQQTTSTPPVRPPVLPVLARLREQAAQLDARAFGLESSAADREKSARSFQDRARKLRERAAGLASEDREALVVVAEDLEVQAAEERATAARSRAEARRLHAEADRLRREAVARPEPVRPWPPARDRFAQPPTAERGTTTTPVVF